jgi:hypothetical protein
MGEVLFHGLVPPAQVITRSALLAALGTNVFGASLTENDAEPWLSFSIDRKRLFVAKKPMCRNSTWKAIYEAGAVYGRDDTGPTGVSYTGITPTMQGKTVTIGGKKYRVRLLKGYPTNPAANVVGSQVAKTINSEWDRLFYSIAKARPAASVYTGPVFANFTDAELGIVDKDAGEGYGGYSWCQEHHLAGDGYRVCRGFYDTTMLYREVFDLNNAGWGWRPVLELI